MRLTIIRARSFDGVAASEALAHHARTGMACTPRRHRVLPRPGGYGAVLRARSANRLRGWVNHGLVVGDALIVRGGDFDLGDTVYVKRSPLDHWRSLKGG